LGKGSNRAAGAVGGASMRVRVVQNVGAARKAGVEPVVVRAGVRVVCVERAVR